MKSFLTITLLYTLLQKNVLSYSNSNLDSDTDDGQLSKLCPQLNNINVKKLDSDCVKNNLTKLQNCVLETFYQQDIKVTDTNQLNINNNKDNKNNICASCVLVDNISLSDVNNCQCLQCALQASQHCFQNVCSDQKTNLLDITNSLKLDNQDELDLKRQQLFEKNEIHKVSDLNELQFFKHDDKETVFRNLSPSEQKNLVSSLLSHLFSSNNSNNLTEYDSITQDSRMDGEISPDWWKKKKHCNPETSTKLITTTELLIKPKLKTVTEIDTETETETKTKTELIFKKKPHKTITETDTKTKTEFIYKKKPYKIIIKTETETETETEFIHKKKPIKTITETKRETKGETKTETKRETKTETKTEFIFKKKPIKTITETETETETETKTKTKTETETETETKTKKEIETETETKFKVKYEATKIEYKPKFIWKTVTETEYGTKFIKRWKTETETETATKTKFEHDTRTFTETDFKLSTRTRYRHDIVTATETEIDELTKTVHIPKSIKTITDLTTKYKKKFKTLTETTPTTTTKYKKLGTTTLTHTATTTRSTTIITTTTTTVHKTARHGWRRLLFSTDLNFHKRDGIISLATSTKSKFDVITFITPTTSTVAIATMEFSSDALQLTNKITLSKLLLISISSLVIVAIAELWPNTGKEDNNGKNTNALNDITSNLGVD